MFQIDTRMETETGGDPVQHPGCGEVKGGSLGAGPLSAPAWKAGSLRQGCLPQGLGERRGRNGAPHSP